MHKLAFILLIIGGLNWLLFGLFGNDIGGWLLGGMDSLVSKIVYILVGLSAIYKLFNFKKYCKACDSSNSGGGMNHGGGQQM